MVLLHLVLQDFLFHLVNPWLPLVLSVLINLLHPSVLLGLLVL